MEKNFISQILEKVGYLSAFAVAFAQYFLRDSFRAFFGEDSKIYSVSSIFALLLSIVVIMAIYSNRYNITLKTYFSNKKRDKYFAYLRKNNNPNPNVVENIEQVFEPRSFTLKHIAFVLIILSIVLFVFFIQDNSIIFKSICYIGFISSIVGSITIYSTNLYLDNDWQQKEKDKKEIILNKIKDYFASDIQIPLSWRDQSNISQPLQRMVVVRQGKKYNVVVDINDPEKFFTVNEIIE